MKRALFLTALTILFGQSWHAKADPPFHLEPLWPFSPGNYDQIVFQDLILQDRPILCMIVKPSFTPEYGFCLAQEPIECDEISVNSHYTIYVNEAREMIWGFRRINKYTSSISPKRKVKLSSYSKQIPNDIAELLITIWSRALENVRYCDEYKGMDGVYYIFRFGRKRFGQTWGPGSGEAQILVNLSEAIIKAIKSTRSPDKDDFESIRELASQVLCCSSV
jgi:hypothetical protein